jgi:signal transduction histidine kinase/HAMP domain-containing protein
MRQTREADHLASRNGEGLQLRSRIRHSIGTKIFVAFAALAIIIGTLGVYGYCVLASAGRMVTKTYDGPLMAINYARAASVDFVRMQQAVLERRLAPAKSRPQIDRRIDDLTLTFFDDLDVAQERLDARDELDAVRKIRSLVTEWRLDWRASERTGADPDFSALDTKILDQFDRLVELNADHSFIGRRMAVWAISDFKYAMIVVTGLSVLLGLAITLLLARRIMRPLRSAVAAANRIAEGEFETVIPASGADETGVLLHSMAVMQDNIRAMVAREKLRAESAEMRLARALETSGEGVVLVGLDGRILLANKKMGDFFPSIGDRLALGSDFSNAVRLAEQDLAEGEVFPRAPETGEGRKPRLFDSVEFQLRDGRWLRSAGGRTEDGCLIFFVSDFTAIKEREDNFRRAQEAAEAASAAKTRFLANISHELRTPLNAIIGFSDIISGQMFGELGNARYVDYATDIQRSGRHLLDIINSVLEISRSDAGKQLLKSEPVDLRYVLRDCSKMMAGQFATAQVSLVIDEPVGGLFVLGEKAKLRQIFLNLISNAMKFTEAGGRVSVSTRREAAAVIIEVADTGIGMTEEHIQIALTPFGQVDNRLERKYEGTGLGLPLARSLAELHGGRLEVESKPGEGTVILIRLPAFVSHELPVSNIIAA